MGLKWCFSVSLASLSPGRYWRPKVLDHSNPTSELRRFTSNLYRLQFFCRQNRKNNNLHPKRSFAVNFSRHFLGKLRLGHPAATFTLFMASGAQLKGPSIPIWAGESCDQDDMETFLGDWYMGGWPYQTIGYLQVSVVNIRSIAVDNRNSDFIACHSCY